MNETITNMLAETIKSQAPGGAMTLEVAIRDWQERIDKLTAERDALSTQLEHANELHQAASDAACQVAKERDAWRSLVMNHNAECGEECRTEPCIVIDSYSGCVNCPELHMIEIPPELEQP